MADILPSIPLFTCVRFPDKECRQTLLTLPIASILQIYKQVNTDGGDGVSIVEFEAWWVQSQRQAWEKQFANHSSDISVEGLVKLLSAFVLLVERSNGCVADAPFFRCVRGSS